MTEEEMIAEIRRDREHGATLLLDAYRARLAAAGFALSGDASGAEDLVLSTVEIAVQQIDRFRGDADFFSWLYGILANLHRNAHRRKESQTVVYTDAVPECAADESDDSVDRLVQEIDGRIVRTAVERLPPDQKEAIILHYFLDMPILQMARFLALPVGTVKSRLHYARLALASRLHVRKHQVALAGAALLLVAVLGTFAAWVGGVFETGGATSAAGVTRGGELSDGTVVVMGLRVVPPEGAASAAQATWLFKPPSQEISTHAVPRGACETNEQEGADSVQFKQQLSTVALAAALPLMTSADDLPRQGVSWCDSEPIAFNSCPGGVGVAAFDAFLSRYRNEAESERLPRFDSREPQGYFIIIR